MNKQVSSFAEDHFEILERIGGGAFGEVFRARSKRDGQLVALKRLHGHLQDSTVLARFAREARTLNRIQSPYVVGFRADGVDAEGRPWLAIDWLEGEDLAQWCRAAPRTLREILSVVRDTALGTQCLHSLGIVHRDLKPANIFLVQKPGEAARGVLVDLGIAHLLDATALTDAGTILGSPLYMAPEQVRGLPLSAAVDLWALGAVLFELLTGSVPFPGANVIAVLGKILLEPVPALDSLVPGLPKGLVRLLERLLDKSVDTRLSHSASLVSELEQLLSQGGMDRLVTLSSVPSANTVQTSESAERMGAGVAGQQTAQKQAREPAELRLLALLFARAEQGSSLRGGTAGSVGEERLIATEIERFGGRAEQVQDVWIGAFGLTRSRGDELGSAARAALAIRREGLRVGLVTGLAEVFHGTVSPGILIERGAILLERVSPGEAQVWSDASARLEQDFECMQIEGCEQLVLVGERERDWLRPQGSPARLLGKEIPLLGRGKELALLRGLYTEALQESCSRLSLIVGEAGIGKSRLMHELLAVVQAQEPTPMVVFFRGDPLSFDAPHGLVVRGLRRLLRVDEAEAPSAERARLRASLETWLPGERVSAQFLGEFLRVGSDTEALPELREAQRDPAFMRQRVRESLSRLLRSICLQGPLLLVVDDIHWADHASIDLLTWLFEELSELPLVLLAFGRPELFERHTGLWRSLPCTELRLAPLSQRASEQLVDAAISVDHAERHALAQRGSGNPLFLEELVRARAAGVHHLPEAVQAVLQVRLDSLGAEARRVAQLASVFGQSFWAEGVAALRPSVGLSIAQLVRAEIVLARPSSRFPQTTEYMFHHALLRDAAYAMLVTADRQELHARAATWLEAVGETDSVILARHYEVGNCLTEAAGWYARAAVKALAESAFAEAELHATRVLHCEPDGARSGEILLLRAEARRVQGRAHAMLEDAHAARAVALRREDAALEIRARAKEAEALHTLGDLDGAHNLLREVLEESHAALLASRIQGLLELTLIDLVRGRGEEALNLADEVLAWLEASPEDSGYQALLALRARSHALCTVGLLGPALVASRRALQAALDAGHRGRTAEARVTLAHVLVAIGRAGEALRELETALADAKTLRAPETEAHAWHERGKALGLLGEFDQALAAQDRAIEIGTGLAARHLVGTARLFRWLHSMGKTGSLASLDDLAALRQELEPYAPLCSVADALRAKALLAQDDKPEAERAAVQAMQSLENLGSLAVLEDFVRLTHVQVLQACGRSEQADAALDIARMRVRARAASLTEAGMRTAYEALEAPRRLMALARARLDRA